MGTFIQQGSAVAAADRLFESSWRAVQGELKRRAVRRARGNLEQGQEWLSATAVKALLFFRRSPERIRDPQGFLFLVLDHVFLDSLRRSKPQTFAGTAATEKVTQDGVADNLASLLAVLKSFRS